MAHKKTFFKLTTVVAEYFYLLNHSAILTQSNLTYRTFWPLCGLITMIIKLFAAKTPIYDFEI